MELSGIYPRDAGLYTCKATNRHGQAVVTCNLKVLSRQNVNLEPQLPTGFQTGTESIQKLEEAMFKRDDVIFEEETPQQPRFTVELKDISDVPEGKPIHFDCRVEPVNDSTLRIDWFHNGKPFATGSRVHMVNDFVMFLWTSTTHIHVILENTCVRLQINGVQQQQLPP